MGSKQRICKNVNFNTFHCLICTGAHGQWGRWQCPLFSTRRMLQWGPLPCINKEEGQRYPKLISLQEERLEVKSAVHKWSHPSDVSSAWGFMQMKLEKPVPNFILRRNGNICSISAWQHNRLNQTKNTKHNLNKELAFDLLSNDVFISRTIVFHFVQKTSCLSC